MLRSISIVAALAASLALAAAANAAGLGRLTVLSTLGEPLAAEIEIVSLQPGEDEGLAARLASADVFAQAGIDVNPALNTVRITIERRDKRAYLRVTTREPISEPFLDLLIELQWPSGRLVREYTFLLDPPEYRSRQQAIAAAAAPRAAAPAAEKPAPAPAAEEPKPAIAARASRESSVARTRTDEVRRSWVRSPCATTLPRSTIATASQTCSTSLSRCELRKTIVPFSRSARMISRT